MTVMTPELREQIRLTLLRALATNQSRFGLPTRFLQVQLASQGLTADLREVEAELVYLQDAKLAATVERPVSPELGAWRVTKEGRDYLAQLGIA